MSTRRRLTFEELESRTLLSVMTPADIRQAYGINDVMFAGNPGAAANGAGQTIAIVDAYDSPTIASDLQKFDAQFNLPNPSFTKVDQNGGSNYPAANASWSAEIALDVEWAHAVAPGANILLVEAASSSFSDLMTAVNYARQQTGVVAVSMSWGAPEFAGETAYDSTFTTPAGHIGGNGLPGSVTFVAASGDNGAWNGPLYPSVSPNVLAVGGTMLTLGPNGSYSSETGWTSSNPRSFGSGGGISAYEPEPGFQTSAQSTGARTTPDVAYNASPGSSYYVYDSANGGWIAVAGTSAGAPQWAGLVAIADQGRALAGQGSLDGATQTLPALYKLGQTASAASFNDIASGSNGDRAGTGYDPVTGLGTPRAAELVSSLANVQGTGTSISFSIATTVTANAVTATRLDQITTTTTVSDPTSSSHSTNGTTTNANSPGFIIVFVGPQFDTNPLLIFSVLNRSFILNPYSPFIRGPVQQDTSQTGAHVTPMGVTPINLLLSQAREELFDLEEWDIPDCSEELFVTAPLTVAESPIARAPVSLALQAALDAIFAEDALTPVDEFVVIDAPLSVESSSEASLGAATIAIMLGGAWFSLGRRDDEAGRPVQRLGQRPRA